MEEDVPRISEPKASTSPASVIGARFLEDTAWSLCLDEPPVPGWCDRRPVGINWNWQLQCAPLSDSDWWAVDYINNVSQGLAVRHMASKFLPDELLKLDSLITSLELRRWRHLRGQASAVNFKAQATTSQTSRSVPLNHQRQHLATNKRKHPRTDAPTHRIRTHM